MLHTCVYRSTTIAATGFNKVDAQEDGWLQDTDGAFVFPRSMDIYTWYMRRNQEAIERFRLESSHWRAHGMPTFVPALGRITATTEPVILPELRGPAKIIIPQLDPIYCYVEDTVGEALVTLVTLWVGDRNFNIASGEAFTLRFTCSVPVQSSVWGSGPLTPELPLPAGRYQVIGMRAIQQGITTGQIARLVFQNQGPRPGVPIVFSNIQVFPNYWRYGNYGAWGEFEHTQIPIVEILSTTTGTEAPLVDLDLIKIR